MIDLDDLTFIQLFWIVFGITLGVIFLCNYTALWQGP